MLPDSHLSNAHFQAFAVLSEHAHAARPLGSRQLQPGGSGSGSGSGGIATNGNAIEGGSSGGSNGSGSNGSSSGGSSSGGGSSGGGSSNGSSTTSDSVRSEGCVGSAVYQFDRANHAIEPDYHPSLDDGNNTTSPTIRQVNDCSNLLSYSKLLLCSNLLPYSNFLPYSQLPFFLSSFSNPTLTIT